VATESLDALLAGLAACGVTSIEARPPTLEELFLREYDDHVPESGRPERDKGHEGGRASVVPR
jgi:ABC-2 type transport system ATP-binding protein